MGWSGEQSTCVYNVAHPVCPQDGAAHSRTCFLACYRSPRLPPVAHPNDSFTFWHLLLPPLPLPQGAAAAGMRVVVVPSLLDASAYDPPNPAARHGVVEHLPSLLAFRPQRYGLPAFGDRLGAAGAGQGQGQEQGQEQGPAGEGGGRVDVDAEEDGIIPMDRVIRIRGKVVKGFGRGSKVGAGDEETGERGGGMLVCMACRGHSLNCNMDSERMQPRG